MLSGGDDIQSRRGVVHGAGFGDEADGCEKDECVVFVEGSIGAEAEGKTTG